MDAMAATSDGSTAAWCDIEQPLEISVLPAAVRALFALVFVALIILALVGNILVCIAIFWDRRLREQTENLFLVSLAVSDALLSVLVMTFATVNDLGGEWVFGGLYCHLWTSFDITCCTASILNLCAISLDRYWHISQPMVSRADS